MSDDQMRHVVIMCYKNSKSWEEKVMKMTREQVIAIFFAFKRRGKIR